MNFVQVHIFDFCSRKSTHSILFKERADPFCEKDCKKPRPLEQGDGAEAGEDQNGTGRRKELPKNARGCVHPLAGSACSLVLKEFTWPG